MNNYIDQQIIDSFKTKKGPFDYSKLTKLLESLNRNYSNGDAYASAILLRAILDHTPPLLGYDNFGKIVSNYPWSETHKIYMNNLLSFKNEGNDVLHTQISEKKDFIELHNLPGSNRLNVYLQECLINGGHILKGNKPSKRSASEDSKIDISLNEERGVNWANFATNNFFTWRSFKIFIKVDNYKSNKPDYIKVSLKGTLGGDPWMANNFLFEGQLNQKYTLNQDYRIEPNEIKEAVVLIGKEKPPNENQTLMPDIDKDNLQIEINTRSGKKILIPIKAALISNS